MRVATVDELFCTKALASADRSKTRDWFDLYHLMRAEGYSFEDFRRAFVGAGLASKFETALTRLCSGRPGGNDEGYEVLLPDPPTLAQITGFFQQARRQWEIGAATEVLGRQPPAEAAPPMVRPTSPPQSHTVVDKEGYTTGM